MQKGSAQILALITVVAVVVTGAYFYLSKNQNYLQSANPIKIAISSTKIYTNSQLDFEFSYSKDLTAKEDSEELYNLRVVGQTVKAVSDFRKNFKDYVTYEPGKFLGAAVVLAKDNSYGTNPFTVWVFDNPNDKSIDVWYKDYWYYPFVWGDYTSMGKITLAPKDEATVSGQMGRSGVIDYQPGKPKFIYVSNSSKMYLFRIIGEDGDKILSTFKFTDQSIEEQFCGGIAGIQCPSGYSCQLDGKYPDAGGKCIKN